MINDKRRSELSEMRGTLRGIVSLASAMALLKNDVKRFASLDVPVLLQGETGTGKTLLARAIHEEGNCGKGPFVAVSCAFFDEESFRKKLFGRGNSLGTIKAAHGETLFFFEIDEVPFTVQSLLFTVLHNGMNASDEPAFPRLIVASNYSLEELILSGKFRHDLFYYISLFILSVPPLRERWQDIISFAFRFFDLFSATALSEAAKEVFAQDIGRHLLSCFWPGNVRELQNIMRRVALATALRPNASWRARFELVWAEAKRAERG